MALQSHFRVAPLRSVTVELSTFGTFLGTFVNSCQYGTAVRDTLRGSHEAVCMHPDHPPGLCAIEDQVACKYRIRNCSPIRRVEPRGKNDAVLGPNIAQAFIAEQILWAQACVLRTVRSECAIQDA